MGEFHKISPLPFSALEVYRWHLSPGTFERLSPPWENMVAPPCYEGISEGSRMTFTLKKGPISVEWVALHRDFIPDRQFVDEQVSGPFRRWVHTHRFGDTGAEQSQLSDHIELTMPMGPLGRMGEPWLMKELGHLFAFRHARTAEDLGRHRRHAGHGVKRFAISGTSGLIGGSLRAYLCGAGHAVLPMVRRAPAGPDSILWNPEGGAIEAEKLEALDGVVHLAGENISGRRWSGAVKERILESRARGTLALCQTLAKLKSPPSVLVSASAIGWYGDRGDEEVDEDAARGKGFLAEVCQAWEEATEPARAAGIRVVNLRIGVALAARGGALARMLTPFKLGLGGPVGTGRQAMSWIGLNDLMGIIEEVLHDESFSGPVNATAPFPLPQREFARALGRILRRPAVVPLPALAVRVAFGEMAGPLLLEGARVMPRKLMATGFPFLRPELDGALRGELGLAGC